MDMKDAARRFRWLLAGGLALAACSLPALAEDIDLFAGNAAGAAAMPNVMILVDNSSNWARSSQKWPDNGKQGVAEMRAIENLLATSVPARIGLAGFTGSGQSIGGYVRFGARDMTVAGNRMALRNILAHIRGDINSSTEKVNDNAEAAGMFEMYRYFTGGSVFRGAAASGDPSVNVDKNNNNGDPSHIKPTAYGQGLRSGFGVSGSKYVSPGVDGCGRNYLVLVINNAQGQIPSGSPSYDGVSAGAALPAISEVSSTSWTDEWARFLYQAGISVYVLDAYNAQQNEAHSRVLARAASVGGGRYYAVKNQSDIELALGEILAEVNAVDSNFSTASLPMSSTNRSQSLNQVYIGMFRPDASAKPRWPGNLKRYHIGVTSGDLQLLDSTNKAATNAQTGFIAHCAVSDWTSDSATYWQGVLGNRELASQCGAFPLVGGARGSEWSDMPDGPTVEKGGVAEVLRKGNNPPTTNTAPTWLASSRRLLTFSSTASTKVTTLTASVTGWDAATFSWATGLDDTTTVTEDRVSSRPYSEFISASTTPRTRPSLHGDVIHSRPLPVEHGATRGVTVYYGANDGFLRAVDGATGRERWAFMAPEHFARIPRLRTNAPLVSFPGVDPDLLPKAKDYFFDGSIGLYQKADNSVVWIFPSMRRGGRMLYGMDVSDPESPAVKWRIGCPNLTNDTGCTTGLSGIGQTWSMPAAAFLKGWSTSTPVLIVGGGYDVCEDADSAKPACGTGRKGAAVYVINADTGALLHTFAMPGGSVAADVALADVDGDGSVDYGYAVTTSGEIWRMDFSDAMNQAQDVSGWGIRKLARASGSGRKFHYPPALMRAGTKMYLALGSGNRERPLSANYPYANGLVSRFYVLLDDLSVRASSTAEAIDLDTDTGMNNYTQASASTCAITGVTPSSGKKGWFMDLPGRGEQVVSSALIAGGAVAFNTHRASAPTAQSCTASLGVASGYWVNLLNGSGAIGASNGLCGGTRSADYAGGGLPPSPTLVTVLIQDSSNPERQERRTATFGTADREGGASNSQDPNDLQPSINSRRRTVFWNSSNVD